MKEESVVIKPAAINFIGTFAVSAIVLGVVTFLLLGLSKYIGFFLKGSSINIISLLVVAAVGLTLAGIVVPIVENIFTQELEINGREVVYSKGFLTKRTTSIGRNYIFSVEVTQNFYQRLVGTGDILVISGGYAVIHMYGAADPFGVVEKYLGSNRSFSAVGV